MVVKRALRIGTFDTKLKEFIGNSMQIEVDWNPKKEGEWKFPDAPKDGFYGGLNPLYFRSTKDKDLNRDDIKFVFELVIYLKHGSKEAVEMACGWAECPLSTA